MSIRIIIESPLIAGPEPETKDSYPSKDDVKKLKKELLRALPINKSQAKSEEKPKITEEITTMNGKCFEPHLLYEGSAYTILSVNNNVFYSNKTQKIDKKHHFNIAQLHGPRYVTDGSHEKKFPNQDIYQDNRSLEDLKAFLQDQDINSSEIEEFTLGNQKQVLTEEEISHLNKKIIGKLLQERYMPHNDETPHSPRQLKSKIIEIRE